MSCGGCASRVEGALRRLGGVKQANVSFATAKLRLEYDEGRLSLDDVTRAVNAAGCGIAPRETASD